MRGVGTTQPGTSVNSILYGALEPRGLDDKPAPTAPDSAGRLVMLPAAVEKDAWRVGWIGSRYSIYMRGPNAGSAIWQQHDHGLTEGDLKAGSVWDDEGRSKIMNWQEIPRQLKQAIFSAEKKLQSDDTQVIGSNTIPVVNCPAPSRR